MSAAVERRWAAVSAASKAARGIPARVARQAVGLRGGDKGAAAGALSTAADAAGASAQPFFADTVPPAVQTDADAGSTADAFLLDKDSAWVGAYEPVVTDTTDTPSVRGGAATAKDARAAAPPTSTAVVTVAVSVAVIEARVVSDAQAGAPLAGASPTPEGTGVIGPG